MTTWMTSQEWKRERKRVSKIRIGKLLDLCDLPREEDNPANWERMEKILGWILRCGGRFLMTTTKMTFVGLDLCSAAHKAGDQAGESWTELPGDHHQVSQNASTTAPAKLLAVFVVDTSDREIGIPDK